MSIYKDHKNLTYNNFIIERVLLCILMLVEYGPTFKYIKFIAMTQRMPCTGLS